MNWIAAARFFAPLTTDQTVKIGYTPSCGIAMATGVPPGMRKREQQVAVALVRVTEKVEARKQFGGRIYVGNGMR
jgi:hypothetical protein